MSTFTFHNPSGSSYFVLETIPRKTDGIYPTSSNQIDYISGSSFINVTSSIKTPFILNDFKFGVVIPPGTSSFVWGPSGSVEIPASQSRIIGTGMFDMTIGDDAFTYKELYNWTNSVPKITPGGGGGGGGITTISNISSMEFDAASANYIALGTGIGDQLGSSYNGVISISAWFYFNGSWNNSINDGIIQIGGSLSNNYGKIAIYGAVKALYVDTSNNSGTKVTSKIASVDQSPYSFSNRWVHTVVVWDLQNSANSKIYIDGSVVDLTQGSNLNNWTTDTIDFTNKESWIGAYFNSTLTWNGMIDEVAVFTSSLDASTIESIYSASLPLGSNVTADLSTLPTPPVAWYRMGD